MFVFYLSIIMCLYYKTFLHILMLKRCSKINSCQGIKYIHKNIHNNVAIYSKRQTAIEFAYSIIEKNNYAVNINSKIQSLSVSEDVNNNLISKKISEINKFKWSKESSRTLFVIFANFGRYCITNNICISDKRFIKFINLLKDKMNEATDDELKNTFLSLSKLTKTKSVQTKTYREVCSVLDKECLKRIPIMTIDEILTFMSLFYLLNLVSYSIFCNKCLHTLESMAKSLTRTQFVQTMFYFQMKNNRHLLSNKQELSVYFQNHISEFKIEELSIISMAYFRTNTPIRSSKVINKIIDKIIENSHDVHEISLSGLLKVVRISSNIYNNSKIYDLLDCLQHQVIRLSVMCNVQIALVGHSTLIFHKSCLKKIAEKAFDSMSSVRIKDLERLALTFGTFNFMPSTEQCFFKSIVVELKKDSRLSELHKYFQSFAMSIVGLGYCGVYSYELMKRFLNREFLENAYGKHYSKFKREVLIIHNLAQIFYKDHNISDLQTEEIIQLSKMYGNYVPNGTDQNLTEKIFNDIKKILKDIRGGDKYVIDDYILNHHSERDIIICNDPRGNHLPVDAAYVDRPFGLLRYPPDDNMWVVLIIVGRNNLIHNSNVPVGRIFAKQRELNKMGYHATIVTCNDYNFCENRNKKVGYLQTIINDIYKNK